MAQVRQIGAMGLCKKAVAQNISLQLRQCARGLGNRTIFQIVINGVPQNFTIHKLREDNAFNPLTVVYNDTCFVEMLLSVKCLFQNFKKAFSLYGLEQIVIGTYSIAIL
jgi:hypothetical protein